MTDGQYLGICLNLMVGFAAVSFQIILVGHKIVKAIERRQEATHE